MVGRNCFKVKKFDYLEGIRENKILNELDIVWRGGGFEGAISDFRDWGIIDGGEFDDDIEIIIVREVVGEVSADTEENGDTVIDKFVNF